MLAALPTVPEPVVHEPAADEPAVDEPAVRESACREPVPEAPRTVRRRWRPRPVRRQRLPWPMRRTRTSGTRRLLAPAVLVLTVVVGGSTGVARPAGVVPQPSSGGVVVAYSPPLPGTLRVLTPFDPPATPYSPGHLGVDLAAAPGSTVRSAGPGVVRFAGPVAGRGVVVIAHPDGVETEYEPLRPAVRAGAQVAAGSVIGRIVGRHGSCAPASCLHWGARRGAVYLDPLDLLRALGPVRLLPWAG